MRSVILKVIGLISISICSLRSNGQRPPEVFMEGLKNFQTNPELAKKQFYEALALDSTFFGSYNFIGILLADEKKYDSSIYYLENSARLNTANTNHTKEMTLQRLPRTYVYVGDFEKAYKTALGAVKEYPTNKNLLFILREVCLWSYNVNYGGLSKNYLVPELKSEYNVNSVSQEYLVMRNLVVNGKGLTFKSQSFDGKRDMLYCDAGGAEVKLIFNLGWDVMKTFGDNMPDYKIVYQDKSKHIWNRLGAILSHDANTELLKEIEHLTQ